MNAKNNRPATSIKEQKITSLEIAEISGMTHANLLKSIRKQEVAWEKFNGVKFYSVEYKDAKGENRPMYELTQKESLYISSKFNDEVRAKLVMRWFELEQNQKPNPLHIEASAGAFPEKTVITVKMGNYSNQIYVIDGVIFAKLAPIARMMGHDSTPTHLLNRWGSENSLKVQVGKQEQWFINVLAFSEWVKISNRVPYGTISTIYKDVFNIDRKKDEDNPYTYFYTDSEMNEIFLALFKKPINKDQVVELLSNGKINKNS